MYVCGKNVVKEYLDNNEKIQKVYAYKKFGEPELISKINKKQIPIEYLEKHELDKLTKENHQGIIIQIENFKYAQLEKIIKENTLLVILDHIEDPHNFGAIIRTCEAAGVDGIIIPKDRSVDVNSTVIRTSVGASKYVPVVQVTNIVSTMKELKKKGFWFFGTDMAGTDYTKLDYKGNTCLIIGNEGKGMSRIIKEECDFIASIPMNGKINSLNASVAAGIIIYEAVKIRSNNAV